MTARTPPPLRTLQQRGQGFRVDGPSQRMGNDGSLTAPVADWRPVSTVVSSREVRPGADALDLPVQFELEVPPARRNGGETQAGRRGIEHEQGTLPAHAAAPAAARRSWARRSATAALARRARTESARLVSTTGTRAPSTSPALSGLSMADESGARSRHPARHSRREGAHRR